MREPDKECVELADRLECHSNYDFQETRMRSLSDAARDSSVPCPAHWQLGPRA